jgi:KaiC/GvpD/RAD55 family RecA-like ATPase
MDIQFKKAEKYESKLRLAIQGPAGSGKTWTALTFARALGKRIAFVDTEHGSASKYSDVFDFDVIELDEFSPLTLIEAIDAAGKAGYDVLIIDSLSHFWSGPGGMLEMVDDFAKRNRSGNTYVAWKEGTPIQNRLVESIIRAPTHIIATMRSKTKYVLEEKEGGKMSPKKMGMEPIQRDGIEYEFDVECEMEAIDNTLIVGKTRCPALNGKVFRKPDEKVMVDYVIPWLRGKKPEPKPEPQAEPKKEEKGSPATTAKAAATKQPAGMSAEKREAALAKIYDMLKNLNEASIIDGKKKWGDEQLKEYLMFHYGQETPEALSDTDMVEFGKMLAAEVKELRLE